MQKPQIIFTIDTLNSGGIATCNMRWSRQLLKHGYVVKFFVYAPEEILTKELPEGVEVVQASGTAKKTRLADLKTFLSSLPPEQSIIISGNLATIDVEKVRPKDLKHWAVLHSVTYLYYRNSLQELLKKQRFWKWLKLKYKLRNYQKALLNSDLWTSVAKGTMEDGAKFLGQDMRSGGYIYNPACTDVFFHAKENTNPAHPWLENPELFTFISCGRLHGVKCFENLINAFAALHKNHPQARLLILGAGPLEETLEAQIQNLFEHPNPPIALIGNRPNPEAYVAHADAYICTSKTESFGNAIVEALATGTPVISADAPYGPREILEDGKYGTLVPVGDEAALAQAMENHLEGNITFNAEFLQARAKDFTAEALFPQFEKYLNQASNFNKN